MSITIFAALVGSVAGLVYLFRFLMDKRSEQIISDRTKTNSQFNKKHNDVDVNKYTGLLFNIGLAFSLAIVLTAFEWKSEDGSGDISIFDSFNEEMDEVISIPPTNQDIPPPPKIIKQPIIIEVLDEKKIEESIVLFDIEETEKLSPKIIIDDEPDEPEDTAPEWFVIVESPAQPVGGFKKFYQFIKKKLKYPKQARRMGVEGRVYVEFIIDQTGAVTAIKVVKGIGAGCDKEAKRVMELAPKWTIPKQRGVPVKQKIVVPIMFKLG